MASKTESVLQQNMSHVIVANTDFIIKSILYRLCHYLSFAYCEIDYKQHSFSSENEYF